MIERAFTDDDDDWMWQCLAIPEAQLLHPVPAQMTSHAVAPVLPGSAIFVVVIPPLPLLGAVDAGLPSP